MYDPASQNLTSNIEYRIILARVHIRQRLAVRQFVRDIRVLQKLDALVVFIILSNVVTALLSYLIRIGDLENGHQRSPG
jgi:hypothetical protein